MGYINRSLLAHSTLVSLLIVAGLTGCGSDETPAEDGAGGAAGSSGGSGNSSGGASTQSGGTSSGSGGVVSAGGASTGSGGQPVDPDGGGGVSGSGGAPSGSGGTPSGSGGTPAATGGTPPATGGAPAGPKCGTDYNDDPTCNACMNSKCCDQLKACVPDSPCEKFLVCAVDNCPTFNSACLSLFCTSVASGAQATADLIECRQTCETDCAKK